MAEPRAYPIAFYWVVSQDQTKPLIQQAAAVLARALEDVANGCGIAEGEPPDAAAKREHLVLLKAVGVLNEPTRRAVYARTLEFDACRQTRVKEYFDAFAGQQFADLVTLGPGPG